MWLDIFSLVFDSRISFINHLSVKINEPYVAQVIIESCMRTLMSNWQVGLHDECAKLHSDCQKLWIFFYGKNEKIFIKVF